MLWADALSNRAQIYSKNNTSGWQLSNVQKELKGTCGMPEVTVAELDDILLGSVRQETSNPLYSQSSNGIVITNSIPASKSLWWGPLKDD